MFTVGDIVKVNDPENKSMGFGVIKAISSAKQGDELYQVYTVKLDSQYNVIKVSEAQLEAVSL